MRTLLLGLVLLGMKTNAQLGPEHRFAYPTTYPSYPENALAIHDMDGDGDGDVVFNSGDHLWLNEQTSPGTYYMTADLGSVSTARHFRTGDVDGDGVVDLVFLEEMPNRIAYLPILGGGSFGAISDLVVTWPGMIDFQLGDMDGDLDLDLVLTTEGTFVEILWCANDGAGVFGAPASLFTDANNNPPHWNTFALADLDGDLDLDLAVPASATNAIRWLRNDGGGSFTDLPVGTWAAPKEIVAAQLDDDPAIDLVVSAREGSGFDETFALIPGNGDGTFGPGAVIHTFYTAYTHQLTTGDIDDDGDNDLLFQWGVPDISDGPLVEALQNMGNGVFGISMVDLGFYSDSGKPFAMGDLNGNALPDLASTANDGLWVTLDEELATASRLNSLAQPKHVTAAQFTGSDLPDVVLSGDLYHGPLMEGTRPLQMALHVNESGVVSESPGSIWQPPSGSGIRGAYPADLDNDGDQDLLARWQEPWTGSWRRWAVFLNNGGSLDSTFAVGQGEYAMLPDADIPHMGDLDNDGDLDLVWRGLGYDFVTSENNGDGSFASPQPSMVGTFPGVRTFGVCDVDQDGAHDYVWIRQDSMTWAPYLDNGQAGTQTFLGMAPIQADVISTLDMDGNGTEDLVLLSDDSIAFLFNDGNNGFINGESFPYDGWSFQWPIFLNHELGDLDGNGFPDLIAIGGNGDIFYYPNFGSGDMGGPFTLLTGAEHSGRNDIALADMDGDGDLDVLTCSEAGAAAWLGNEGLWPTAVTEVLRTDPLTLYPNPMSDVARVIFPEVLPTHARIELLDVNGRVVRTLKGSGTRELSIDRDGLPTAVYTLRIVQHDRATNTVRLIVH